MSAARETPVKHDQYDDATIKAILDTVKTIAVVGASISPVLITVGMPALQNVSMPES